MILVLKDADFSANNIGQVDIDRNLNAYTLAAITASGSDNLTDAQKFALDDLFLAMGVDGSNQVMSKITKLYLPMIASDVSNALINYATNSFAKDFTPNATDWQLRSHGITQKTTGGQYFQETLTTPLVGTNITHMWLRTENMESGVSDAGHTFILRGKTDSTKRILYKEDSVGSSNNVIAWSDNTYGFVINNKSISKSNDTRMCVGYSIRSASDQTINFYGNDTERTITINTDMSGETQQTLYVLGHANQLAPKPYGFMLLGEGISETDFNNIAAKVNALYAAISV